MTTFPHRLVASALGAALFIIAGCNTNRSLSPYHSFQVDAVSNSAIYEDGPRPYVLVSPSGSVPVDKERHARVENYIRTALGARGWFEAAGVGKAERVIEVSYGIEKPRVGLEKRYHSPFDVPTQKQSVRIPETDEDGNTTYRTVELAIDHHHPFTVSAVTNYEKHLKIKARDARGKTTAGKPTEVWEIHVRNMDESDDLEKYLPLLVSVAMPYVGETTAEQQVIRIRENHADVIYVKNGLDPERQTEL